MNSALPPADIFTLACLAAGLVTCVVLVVGVLVMHWALETRRPLSGRFGGPTLDCPRWHDTGGDCCPAGAVRPECPGYTLLRPANAARSR